MCVCVVISLHVCLRVAAIAQNDLVPFLTVVFVRAAHTHCTDRNNIGKCEIEVELKYQSRSQMRAERMKNILTCTSPLSDPPLQISITIVLNTVQQ